MRSLGQLRGAVVATVLGLSACYAPPSADRFSAYPVYSAVLEASAAEHGPARKGYLETETVDLVMASLGGLDMGGLARELEVPAGVLRDFNIVNASSSAVVDSVFASMPVELFPVERQYKEGEDLYRWEVGLADEFGTPFYLFSFSRPGFSREGDTALVYYSYYCGSLCGAGYVAFLHRDAEEWRIVRETMAWIS